MSSRGVIEFPCEHYPIKVLGISDGNLETAVVEIVRRHDHAFEPTSVQIQPSSRGNYASVRLSILATGEPQLKALHAELIAHPLVKLVL